ncbi:MAG: hypothetical protein IPM54_43800 [Polyangiaceae bacterium]|nr:hypothetical protein [Polyangiaceae bacterium]
MRSRHLYGIMLAALAAFTAGSAGCDNDNTTTPSGGSGGQGGENVGGGGAGGSQGVDMDGNTSCDTAVPYVLGAMDDAAGKLDPVAVDRDYYKVELKKDNPFSSARTANQTRILMARRTLIP